MEAWALRSLTPISRGNSLSSTFGDKGEPQKIWVKFLCKGYAPDNFREISKRRFLSEFVALGAAVLYANPCLSVPLQEAKDPELIRYQKLNSGVKFQDIVEGVGLEAQEGDLVEINYVCRRSNGYYVHSTVNQFDGESRPVVLSLDEKEIIKGLKDVLVGMKVGGKRRALIPPDMGYVNENLKPIPDEFGPRRSLLSHANEPLIFEVQLLKVL
uniref:peptidylprolyl isomerase n=1 Tax=Elaeis guineensis var. tenera TaxID=51953 RepID=A0A6I9RM24_ELAGV|nr:peptidyl-prolyl cis-trans isomerase FKBP16-1, chloroplastic [Elaeis guineensis]